MGDNFYSAWFSMSQLKPISPEDSWKRNTEFLRNMAQGDWATSLAERFDVPEVTEAEAQFKSALQEISDPEVRDAIDMAAGKISRAYQILGFCAGRFSTDSRAQFL